jgi:flagellar biosynthetic protein FliR
LVAELLQLGTWYGDYGTVLARAVLVSGRISGLFVTAPVLSSRLVPMQVKLLLLVVLSGFYGLMLGDRITLPPSPLVMAGWFCLELATGSALGMLASMLVGAVQVAFQVVDVQTGFGAAGTLDPSMGSQGTVLEQTSTVIALLALLAVNGHHQLLAGLWQTFLVAPPGAFMPSWQVWETLQQASSMMFMIALKMGAPLVAMLLMADLCFGLLARTVPQMNVFFTAFPVKIALTLLALALASPEFVRLLEALFSGLTSDWAKLLAALR